MTEPDFVHNLPKVDLHLHLDGAIRTETIVDLAEEHGVTLPTTDPKRLESHVTVPPDCRNLSEFLSCFETFYPVIQYPEALERVAFELCEDLSQQNIIYAETRFAPVLLTEESSSQEEVVEAVREGLRRGNDTFDTTVNLILCLYRGTTLEDSQETVDVALQYQNDPVVGVDLAGDESQYGIDEHREALLRAVESSLGVTIHAGEAGSPENVRNALDLGADRIGHGVKVRGDLDLIQRIREEGVPLEVCYTSNLQTQAVSKPKDHPMRSLYDQGVNVTINTDDPRVSHTNLVKEYRKVSEQFGFTSDELVEITLNAAKVVFADENQRKVLIDEIQNFDT